MTDLTTGENAPAQETNRYWRFAVWIAIGALIAAAIVCVVWVLIGTQNGIVPRAFLTVLLLTAFAGIAVMESSLAARRPQWYMMLSMIGWVVVLLAGAVKIWTPQSIGFWDDPGTRLVQFLLIVLIVRLAILHVWLFLRAHLRRPTAFNAIAVGVTIGLVGVLAVLLVIPLAFAQFEFFDFYWRVVVAVTILAAVGTAIVPLVRVLLTPRPASAAAPGYGAAPAYVALAPAALQPWPTYADGVTPLPVLPDGTPDINAYYTGYPTYPQHPYAAPVDPHAAQWAADQAAAAHAAQAAWAGGQVGAPDAGAASPQAAPEATPTSGAPAASPAIPPVPPLPPQ